MVSSISNYGAIEQKEKLIIDNEHSDDDDDDDYDDDSSVCSSNSSDSHDSSVLLREELNSKIQQFTIPVDPEKMYRATQLALLNFDRPHMRTFHGSWICFCCGWLLWFSITPLLPQIRRSYPEISMGDVWISNMFSMMGAVVLRLLLGPLCDQHGAKHILTNLLLVSSIVCGLGGVVIHGFGSLVFFRTVIGCVGGMLVPAQYWITSLFVREVCGMAMALAAGWAAIGGGLAQVLMGTIVFPFVNDFCLGGGNPDLAWRLSLLVPAAVSFAVGYYFKHYSDDCPLGTYENAKRAGLMQERSAVDSFRSGVLNLNAWLLFFQFGSCLGIELAMECGLTLHLRERFDLTTSHASALASLYGLMNIFTRGLGGYISDFMYSRFSLRGRLCIHWFMMVCEGIGIFIFAETETLRTTIVAMVVFASFGQMSMGTCFGIVPYVDGPNTGTIAGIVGAGGNVGAIWLGNVFRIRNEFVALRIMASFCICMSLLTPLIVIKGYRGIFFDGSSGNDTDFGGTIVVDNSGVSKEKKTSKTSVQQPQQQTLLVPKLGGDLPVPNNISNGV